jgi:hypothetical protein
MTAVRVRRYQCQRCGTCMLVVPGEVLRRRLDLALGHAPSVRGPRPRLPHASQIDESDCQPNVGTGELA